ncbi:cellular retinoic acid-binding protein 2 isoform X2 [Leopardus geoffroyi]|uniref:cellular retinoic acid-binding protein 2 isoform X2 n=1 Tax=Leopardus geoffroyi TaxID=46844 RepID=UPI001E25E608|nr:cellular retinoic acid-binding protein 2 isoform X2 [Leopardus geoffroyi]
MPAQPLKSSGSERGSPAGSAAGCGAPRGRAHRVRGGPGAGYKSCPRGSPSQLRGCPGTCPGSRVSRPGDGDISLDEKTRRPVLRPKHHAQLLRQLEDHPIGKLRGFAQSAGGERDAEEDRRGGGIQAGGGDQAGGRHFLHQNLHHGAHHGDQLQDRRGVRGADGGRETLQGESLGVMASTALPHHVPFSGVFWDPSSGANPSRGTHPAAGPAYLASLLQSLVKWESENKMVCEQRLLKGEGPKTSWTRELTNDGELVLTMTADDIVCTRVYVRE